jgi:uncharacterized lipoprotein YbaY
MRHIKALSLILALAWALCGCAVVSVAGAVASTAISVSGAVATSTARVTGKVVEKTIDVAADVIINSNKAE